MKLDVARGDLTFDVVQYGVISNHLSSRLYRNLTCVRCSRFPGQYVVRNAQFSPNTNTIPQSEDYATRLRGYNLLTSIYTNPRSECISISDQRADSELS